MAKPYDSIFKEIFERVVPELATTLLHLRWGETEELKDKLQITHEQEADYLKKLVFRDTNQACIFHAEFQVKEKDRRSWMLLERALLRNKYGLEVRQVVFFLGNKRKPWYPNAIKEHNLETRFDVIVVKNVPVDLFLKSSIPEVVMLAVLADFGEQKPETIIEVVLCKLQELSGNQRKFQQLVNQLERLSNLRKLQPQTAKSLEAMPLTIEDVIGKIENDRLYKKGHEKGLEKGLEKGIHEATMKFIISLLRDGRYKPEEIASLTGETLETVLSIKKELETPKPPPASKAKPTRKPKQPKNKG
jgi:hypothetical protein